MSKYKKTRIARGLGASALALATLASGLSFGAAASAAPVDDAMIDTATAGAPLAANGQRVVVDPNAPAAGKPAKLIFKNEGWDKAQYPYRAADFLNQSGGLTSLRYLTLPAAEAETRRTVTVPSPGIAQQLKSDDSCIAQSGFSTTFETCNSNNARQRWYIDDAGKIRSYSEPSVILSAYTDESSIPLWANVQGKREGTPGYLPVGVELWAGEQYANPLAATIGFGMSVDQLAVVSGKTVANGAIEVRRGSKVVGKGTAGDSGEFRIAVTAPNKAGDDTLTVALVENGADKKTITVTAEYGDGVAITDPANNAPISGRHIVSGTAQVGSSVVLQVGDGETHAVVVASNGQWSADVMLPRGETKIVATQTSKGANITSATVTVNPGESNIAPLVIQTPADGETVQADSNRVEFSGTGEPGARVQVQTQGANPRTIVNTLVRPDGTWSQLGQNLAFNVNYVLDTIYTPSGQAAVNGMHRVTLKDANPGVSQPFEFSTPPNGSEVVAPDKRVRLAGSGTTGTTVSIWAFKDKARLVGTATVGKDGTWEIPAGAFNNQNTLYDLHVEYTVPGQATQTLTHSIIVKAQAGVERPFQFDSPAAESTVIAPDHEVMFDGIGTTGTEVVIYNDSGKGRVVAKASADAQGKWVAKGLLNNANKEYNLHVEYTEPGKQTVSFDRHIYIKAENSTERPFEVSNPQEGSTVALTNSRTLVDGTGTTGGRVKVWNWKTKDRIVIEGREVLTVDEDGRWSGIGEFAAQGYDLHIEYFAPSADIDGEPTQVITRHFTATAAK